MSTSHFTLYRPLSSTSAVMEGNYSGNYICQITSILSGGNSPLTELSKWIFVCFQITQRLSWRESFSPLPRCGKDSAILGCHLFRVLFLSWFRGTGTGATIMKHLFLSAPAFQLPFIASVGGCCCGGWRGRARERFFYWPVKWCDSTVFIEVIAEWIWSLGAFLLKAGQQGKVNYTKIWQYSSALLSALHRWLLSEIFGQRIWAGLEDFLCGNCYYYFLQEPISVQLSWPNQTSL